MKYIAFIFLIITLKHYAHQNTAAKLKAFTKKHPETGLLLINVEDTPKKRELFRAAAESTKLIEQYASEDKIDELRKAVNEHLIESRGIKEKPITVFLN